MNFSSKCGIMNDEHFKMCELNFELYQVEQELSSSVAKSAAK